MNTNRLEKLNNSIQDLEKNTNKLEGKLNLLKSQLKDNESKEIKLKELQIINKKAIEVLNTVQSATKDIVKSSFENIVTKALQYIHQDDNYGFGLEFGKRGNIPELNFLIKTPDMQELHNILDTNGGGTTDIVSLALRLVLLEVSKTEGFLFLDEPEKHLDSPETQEKMVEFVKEIQRDTNRQIFWITHKETIINETENPIILK